MVVEDPAVAADDGDLVALDLAITALAVEALWRAACPDEAAGSSPGWPGRWAGSATSRCRSCTASRGSGTSPSIDSTTWAVTPTARRCCRQRRLAAAAERRARRGPRRRLADARLPRPVRPGRRPPAAGARRPGRARTGDSRTRGCGRRADAAAALRVVEGGVLGRAGPGGALRRPQLGGPRPTWPAGRRPATRSARRCSTRGWNDAARRVHRGLRLRRAGRLGAGHAAGRLPAGRSTRGCAPRSTWWSGGCPATACCGAGTATRPASCICSFWLVQLPGVGRRAGPGRRLFAQLAARANDLGLFAEQIDQHTGEQLGNFPQAFSHIGLINAAGVLTDVEQDRRCAIAGCPRRTSPRRVADAVLSCKS